MSGLRPWTCMCTSSCVFYESVWHYEQCISYSTVYSCVKIALIIMWLSCTRISCYVDYQCDFIIFAWFCIESMSSYLTCLSLQPVFIYLCVTCENPPNQYYESIMFVSSLVKQIYLIVHLNVSLTTYDKTKMVAGM